jgi:hypothetical protein
MSLYTRFTVAWIFYLLVAFIAAGALLFFLRKITVEYAKREGTKKHWWRYAVPTAVAILLASFQRMGSGTIAHYLYLIFVGLLIPFAVAFFVLRESIEGKKERILMIFSLLLFLNVSFFTTHWYYHYRGAHSGGFDDGINPHLSERNWFLIPFWVVTFLVALVSAHIWRKEARKENEALLPSNEQPELP